MEQLPKRFLFMKVGNHAGETWEQILARKKREFEDTGMIFWGYGGNACHPISQVQPFARITLKEQESICLVMEPIDSRADPAVLPATEYSRDGVVWEPLPKGIKVTGSRYAFVLDEIKPGDLEISLNKYEVGIGRSLGKGADSYLTGHTDKACLVESSKPHETASSSPKLVRKLGYVAKLKEPFAVLLRGPHAE
ncbi:MAG: hypothetical protein L0Y71_24970 [Gemmataceae bacterium]|nr:hypothetical protein [Gemmataceae bacterium]